MTGGAAVLGNGDGTFGAQVPIGIPGFAVVYSNPADLNGDGKIDLLGTCGANQAICVAFGNGDGTFGPSVANTGFVTGYYSAADFNGDGKMDLIISGGVLPGHGDGTFGPPVFFNYNALELPGDFNRDGRVDVVEADSVFNAVLHGGV
ncbi:MAG TPA: VCBS repeat-containing protein [Bryobacteraceae bacterium]|jgi:hypothetical protein|nr:VCBS repeat-containing protein [Bryobacteraceae bacterium]